MDVDKDGFFKRWAAGTKDYAASLEGQLRSKRIYLGIVIIGLLGGSIERYIDNDIWMFMVLSGFGFIMLIDYYNTNKQIKNLFGGK